MALLLFDYWEVSRWSGVVEEDRKQSVLDPARQTADERGEVRVGSDQIEATRSTTE